MENETNQPALCQNGCGFYGNPATDGMCSKCFKDTVRRKQSSPTASPSSTSTSSITSNNVTGSNSSNVDGAMAAATASISPLPTLPSSSNDSSKTQDRQPSVESQSDPSDDNKEITTKKRNRCFSCRKKVGLTGFECRCGNVFCGLHRYSDKHNCTFDYKAEGRAKITKDNPVIQAEKIQKI